jgi:hypothetical protein
VDSAAEGVHLAEAVPAEAGSTQHFSFLTAFQDLLSCYIYFVEKINTFAIIKIYSLIKSNLPNSLTIVL